MADEYLIELIEKYLNGECTPAEQLEIEAWFEQYGNDEATYHNNDPEKIRSAAQRSLAAIRQHTGLADKQITELDSPSNWRRWIAAAAIVATVITAGYYAITQKARRQQNSQLYTKHDVAPGGNKATLTLASGRQIVLTDAKKGQLAFEDAMEISKTDDGQVVYSGKADNNEMVYNTMTTPRGGQYSLTLADGSRVILNAASTLKYPAQFNDNERRVELAGEAYFEIAHNKNKPFRVVANGQTVEVLGTHFNVMCYKDEEQVQTTLLEGSVKLFNHQSSVLLKPGEQGSSVKGSSTYTVNSVDVSAVTAWKDGLFIFNGVHLKALMRQIARWYDVDVAYEPGVDDDIIYGKISRRANLSKVLKILELSDIHFKLDGRKIIVRK